MPRAQGARAALSELERHELVVAVTSERTRKSVSEHIWVLTRIDCELFLTFYLHVAPMRCGVKPVCC